MRVSSHSLKLYLRLRERVRVALLMKAFAGYFANPAQFCDDCFKWKPDQALTAYQREGLIELEAKRRISFVGPHGLGKTFFLACVIVWFAITSEVAGVRWKIITTAGSWGQLRDYLWPEIHSVISMLDWSKIPLEPFTAEQLLSSELRLKHGFAVAKASKNYKYIEGAHAPRILIVIDEAKAVPVETFNACEGALSKAEVGAYQVVTSTPEMSSGCFFDIHAGRNSSNDAAAVEGFENFTTRHVTKEEVIAAGRMSQEWADEMRRRWGALSALYLNRVEGKFADAGSNLLFPAFRIRRAIDLHRAWLESGKPIERIVSLGSDLAGGGIDQTINAIRAGRVTIELPEWFTKRYGESGEITIDLVSEFVVESSDTMEATGAIASRLQANPGATAVVDVVNIGTPVVSRLRELHLNVIPMRGGKKTEMRDMVSGSLGFVDLRSAWIWRLADLLNPDNGYNVAFPEFSDEGRPTLSQQFSVITYRQASDGRIRVESKEILRKRLRGFSTDAFDTLVYAYAPEADGIFRRHWWRYWSPRGVTLEPVEVLGADGAPQLVECVELPEIFDATVQAWQTAYKDDDAQQAPAFAVGQVLAFKGGDCFVIDQVRARKDFPSACSAMTELSQKYPAAAVKVVDQSQNGKAVIAAMRRQVPGVSAFEPDGMLISRANSIAVSVYQGNVLLPHPQSATFVTQFVQECAEFPNGQNKEQVSALCLGIAAVRRLSRLQQSSIGMWRERHGEHVSNGE